MSVDKNILLRNIPAVDEVMRNQSVIELFEEFPREVILNAVKMILDERRQKIINFDQIDPDELKSVDLTEIIQKISLFG